MSSLVYLLTRGQLDPAARHAGGPCHRVRLAVWELEARVVPVSDVGATTEPTLSPAQAAEPLPIRIPTNTTIPPMMLALPLVAAAPQVGAPPVVWFGDPLTGIEQYRFLAFDLSFRGGVRLAVGDVTGDGVPDLVVGAGPGGGPHVKVFDGRTGTLSTGPLSSFFAFEPGFTGGVNMAVGDRNGDGYADIAVGAGYGGAPRVRVFSGKDGHLLRDFYPLDPSLRCGVSVAFADANGDKLFGLVIGSGPGVPSVVKVYNAVTTGVFDDGQVLEQFTPFEPDFTGGVWVAAGDVNRDGFVDIIAGARTGGGPRVELLNGHTGALMQNFYAFDPSFRGGVTVATIDLTGDGVPEIITGTGPGGGSHARVYDAATADLLHDHTVFGFGGVLNTGLNVAGH